MTKDELINAVIKSCKDDGLTKRLTGDVVDAAFENISKSLLNLGVFRPDVLQELLLRNMSFIISI